MNLLLFITNKWIQNKKHSSDLFLKGAKNGLI